MYDGIASGMVFWVGMVFAGVCTLTGVIIIGLECCKLVLAKFDATATAVACVRGDKQ